LRGNKVLYKTYNQIYSFKFQILAILILRYEILFLKMKKIIGALRRDFSQYETLISGCEISVPSA